MRFLIIAIVLTGCWWPNHKSAKGDDAPAAKRETYTEAVQKAEAAVQKLADESKARDEVAAKTAAEREVKVQESLKGVSETIGNTNNELNAIAEQMRASNLILKEFADEWRSWRDAERSAPLAVPPIHFDVPPPKDADKRTVTIDGKAEDIDAFIKKWYRPNQGFHDPDDGQVLSEHLVAHGVAAADVEGMNYATQHVLHVAVHMKEKADGTPAPKVAAKSKAKAKVKSAPVTTYRMPVQNCPNGRCPAPTYYYYR